MMKFWGIQPEIMGVREKYQETGEDFEVGENGNFKIKMTKYAK